MYRTDDVRYEADFYNEWFVSPNAMLTEQVMNWLTNAGLFQYVMDSSAPLSATRILDGTVTALYGDYRATSPKAVLGLQFFLIDQAASPADIVWHQEYRQEVEVTERSPEALVRGWNAALRLILTALDEDLNNTLSPAKVAMELQWHLMRSTPHRGIAHETASRASPGSPRVSCSSTQEGETC